MNPAPRRELWNAGASQSQDWDNSSREQQRQLVGVGKSDSGIGPGAEFSMGIKTFPEKPRLRSNLQIGIKGAALFPFFFFFWEGGEFQGEGEALMRRQTPLGAPKIFLKI